MVHQISAEHLTIERIGEIIKNGYKIELSDDAKQRIVRCREYLDKKIAETKAPIYGVTTGFGSLCNVSIGKDHLAQLQINLMMSHACGTGDRVPNEIVKIMMLLKIQSLSYGYSGCKLTRWSVLSTSSTTMFTRLSTCKALSERRATSFRWHICPCLSSDWARRSIKARFCRARMCLGKRLEAHPTGVEGRSCPAQRYAEHGRVCCLGNIEQPAFERLGRRNSRHVVGCLLRTCRAVCRRRAPGSPPQRTD